MNGRELRHRITIQRKLIKQELETGEPKESWIDVFVNVPAKISPISVREFISSQAYQSQITARITVRHRPELTADMRIVHNGKIYNPQGWFADPDSGIEYLTAPCSEGVNQG